MLKLILFVLPLGLDTFAISAALGLRGLPAKDRLRASLLMSSFEMAMPVVGLLLGRGLGRAIGGVADYFAAAALLGLGVWMLLADDEAEDEKIGALSTRGGLALIGLGVSISLDELAMGFTIGLLHLSIVLAVVLIGVQAFVLAQLGLRLGARLGTAAREWAERLAAFALIGLGVLVLAEKLVT
jgi:putative Mn2+ efflux pump MntP